MHQALQQNFMLVKLESQPRTCRRKEAWAPHGQCLLYVSRPPANTCMLFLTFFIWLLCKNSNEKSLQWGKAKPENETHKAVLTVSGDLEGKDHRRAYTLDRLKQLLCNVGMKLIVRKKKAAKRNIDLLKGETISLDDTAFVGWSLLCLTHPQKRCTVIWTIRRWERRMYGQTGYPHTSRYVLTCCLKVTDTQ